MDALLPEAKYRNSPSELLPYGKQCKIEKCSSGNPMWRIMPPSGHEKHERMLKYFCAIGIAISNCTRLNSANYMGRLDENYWWDLSRITNLCKLTYINLTLWDFVKIQQNDSSATHKSLFKY